MVFFFRYHIDQLSYRADISFEQHLSSWYRPYYIASVFYPAGEGMMVRNGRIAGGVQYRFCMNSYSPYFFTNLVFNAVNYRWVGANFLIGSPAETEFKGRAYIGSLEPGVGMRISVSKGFAIVPELGVDFSRGKSKNQKPLAASSGSSVKLFNVRGMSGFAAIHITYSFSKRY